MSFANYYRVAVSILLVLVAMVFTIEHYPGSPFIFCLFAVVSVLYFYFCALKYQTFFELFLSLFLTLGFFVKLNYYLLLGPGRFIEPVGSFTGSAEQYDQALKLISISLLAIVIFQKGINRFLNYTFKAPKLEPAQAKSFFLLQAVFFALILVLGIVNFNGAIYQKGLAVVGFNLLNPVLAWGLTFGFSSIMSFFVLKLSNSDYKLKSFVLIFSEIIFSSMSLLSTGFILNATAIGLAGVIQFRRYFVANFKSFFLKISGVLVVLILGLWLSLFLRQIHIGDREISLNNAFMNSVNPQYFVQKAFGRWVGLEGVFSAISFKGDRELTFRRILNESKESGRTSIYDIEVAYSTYRNEAILTEKFKFITLPGIVGWLLLADNLAYLIFGLIGAVLVCNLLELFCFTLNKNIYFSSIIGQVLAFRLTNFGYVPKDSFKLIIAIIMTSLVLFILDRLSQPDGLLSRFNLIIRMKLLRYKR